MSSSSFFESVDAIRFAGPDSDDPLAFRWYDADRVVLGKSMAEHLRFGVCFWHSFAWDGSDIFGSGTLDRPWNRSSRTGDPVMDPMVAAKMKMAAAFEFVSKLGAPFFSFHDIDIAPAGSSFAETCRFFDEMVDEAAGHMEAHGGAVVVGDDERVLEPAVHVGCGDEPRSGPVRVRGGAGRALHG